MDFEFDDAKSRANKQKRGIDFLDAQRLYWSAVVTYRDGRLRLISVRRSRTEEVALYES